MPNRDFLSKIVTHPKGLTVDWIENIIKYQPDAGLMLADNLNVNIRSIDIGTTTRVRLAITHDAAIDFPRLWFVKLPSLSWQAKAITALPRLLPTEVRFYNELADDVPLKIPKKLFAYSCFGYGSTLVIQDVTEFGAIPGKTGEALTTDQARAVVEQLAVFHAVFMEKAKDNGNLSWLAGPVRRLEDFLGTALAVPLMKRGIKLAKTVIPEELHKPALSYAKNRKKIMRFLSDVAPTLVHHDCHPGNLFWHEGQPGFLDWQMVRLGEGVSDISYFLATALEPDVRRACERELLASYHRILSEQSCYHDDFDRLYLRYRAHMAYPFEAMVLTLAVGGLMDLQSNLVMIRRAVHAVQDHNTFGVLDGLDL